MGGRYNLVKPQFTNISLADSWRPTSKLTVDLALKYDSFNYQLANTVSVSVGLSAQECIEALRVLEPEAEHVYYVYVIDDEEHLIGVLSLRDLIVARPETPIAEFIRRNVFTVNLDASRDEVAAMMSKYNLMALPVVDDENRLRGIITVDDALESVLPEGVKRRLPKLVG